MPSRKVTPSLLVRLLTSMVLEPSPMVKKVVLNSKLQKLHPILRAILPLLRVMAQMATKLVVHSILSSPARTVLLKWL